MREGMKKTFLWSLVIILLVSGCGYTTKTVLPENIRSVHVPPVQNGINLSTEIDDTTRYRTYRPGLEVELTDAIINRFIFEGTLKVASAERADAIVEAKVTDYRRDALRYTDEDDVQEYRLSVIAEVSVYMAGDRKVLWHETLAGDTTFFLSGSRAISEDEAAAKAIQDLARRIVERTLTLW